jgi:hypothetical protein
MTLSTRVRITDPVPVADLRLHLTRLLGGDESTRWKHREPSSDPLGYANPRYANEPDQGLTAWLFVHYGADGPLLPEDPEDPAPEPACVEVIFDTTYGYRGPRGGGCGDLHAWLIEEIADYLVRLGRRGGLHWQYEYDGSWHRDTVELAMLGDTALGRTA